MDEIALEERASHHRASNSVIGLCHSHSHLIDPSLHTYDSVLRIAKKLAEGTIHLGKEMSVIAVGLFGDDDIFPVLAAPTCKCKDSEKMMSIFMLVRDRWKETGAEEPLGPIFIKFCYRWRLDMEGSWSPIVPQDQAFSNVQALWDTLSHAGP
jgi:hypothetical protein